VPPPDDRPDRPGDQDQHRPADGEDRDRQHRLPGRSRGQQDVRRIHPDRGDLPVVDVHRQPAISADLLPQPEFVGRLDFAQPQRMAAGGGDGGQADRAVTVVGHRELLDRRGQPHERAVRPAGDQVRAGGLGRMLGRGRRGRRIGLVRRRVVALDELLDQGGAQGRRAVGCSAVAVDRDEDPGAVLRQQGELAVEEGGVAAVRGDPLTAMLQQEEADTHLVGAGQTAEAVGPEGRPGHRLQALRLQQRRGVTGRATEQGQHEQPQVVAGGRHRSGRGRTERLEAGRRRADRPVALGHPVGVLLRQWLGEGRAAHPDPIQHLGPGIGRVRDPGDPLHDVRGQ
jgi:hypothetical protein